MKFSSINFVVNRIILKLKCPIETIIITKILEKWTRKFSPYKQLLLLLLKTFERAGFHSSFETLVETIRLSKLEHEHRKNQNIYVKTGASTTIKTYFYTSSLNYL